MIALSLSDRSEIDIYIQQDLRELGLQAAVGE